MGATDGYTLHYEDVPLYKIKAPKKGRKGVIKMTKEVKTAKTRRVYEKTRAEHYKDIVIAVLITGIVAFVLGMQHQAKHQDAIQSAVQAVQPTAEATELK
jgi:hypothetical protein